MKFDGGENLAALLVVAVLLAPSLWQFLRTRSFKPSQYRKPLWFGVLTFLILGINGIYVAFYWYVWQDAGELAALIVAVLGTTIYAVAFSVYGLFSNDLMLSRSEKIRCLVYISMLIPIIPVNWFVGIYVLVQTQDARRLRDVRDRWMSDRAEFLEKYRIASQRLEELHSAGKSQEIRVREYLQAHPDAVLFRAPRDAREFEQICTNWMQLWGEFDAIATQVSGDGGLDVVSSTFGAQVKFYANSPVGRPEVQALYGAAVGNGLKPVFFAYSNGYTDEALEWAKMTEIACFTFSYQTTTDRFEFEANTEEAAELALRGEGWSYPDWQEWIELEQTLRTFEIEPPLYEAPTWLRKRTAAATTPSVASESMVN